MKRISTALVVSFVVVFCLASPAPDAAYWPASELQRMTKELAPKIDAQKLALQRLGDFGSHHVLMVHRQGDGLSESHATDTDFYVVQDGEATLVIGGEMVEGKSVGPGEIRGSSIKGGTSHRVTAGDVVNIPSGTAHQILVKPGANVSYLIVKIRKQ